MTFTISKALSVPAVAALACAVLVEGCSPKPPPRPAASTATIYQEDVVGGAKKCAVPATIAFSQNQANVPMTVGNDGGWCAITVALPGPKPYASFLLTARPAHGRVYFHTVGDQTRIDYTPDRGFAGPDTFTVKLIPGDAVVHTTVTVAPG